MLRLYLHAPTVVLAVHITATEVAYPVAEIDYDITLSGDYDDVMPGMTVLFGTALGRDDLGRGRIRTYPTATTLYFGRSSQGRRDGEVDFSPGDVYATVLDDHRVWAKMPTMPVVDGVDLTTYKDADIAVGIHTTTPPPVANCGPGYAGTIDPLTGLVTVNLDARNSIAIADGASITDYYWYLPDGEISFGNETWELIEAQFPAGFRWVYLTVTDSNGQEHTACLPVYARDPDDDTSISGFEVTRHTITPQGQQVNLRILQDIPASTRPDGTLVMLWDDDVSPNADRQGMVYIGWHHTDPAQISAERLFLRRDTELTCLDVAGKLDTLPGFPQVLYADSLRDTETHPQITWEYMVNPTIRKYLHYLLHWHSTALEVADFQFLGMSEDYPFLVLESGGASLFDQVHSRAQALTPDHLLTCTRRGELAVRPDPMLLEVLERSAWSQATITEADWTELRYTHQRPPRVYWLRAGAILSQTTPIYREDGELDIPTVFCVAPGEAPGMGETQTEENERLALSQDALNRVTGHRYARLNAPDSRFTVTLAAGDDTLFEPAALEWVVLTLSHQTAAQRRMEFETQAGLIIVPWERGLVQQMDIRYQHTREGLLKTVTLEWEREVVGTPAVTVIPPVAEPAATTEPDEPWWPPPPPADLNPPILTLLGDNPLILVEGSIYVDPGATAWDIEDGDLTAQIVVGGDVVNTAQVGLYVVTYNVLDSAGNAAQPKARTVQVVAQANTTIEVLQEWSSSAPVAGTHTLTLTTGLARYDVIVIGYAGSVGGGVELADTPGNPVGTNTGVGGSTWHVGISNMSAIDSYLFDRQGDVGKTEIDISVVAPIRAYYIAHLRNVKRNAPRGNFAAEIDTHTENKQTSAPCDALLGEEAIATLTGDEGHFVVYVAHAGATFPCGQPHPGIYVILSIKTVKAQDNDHDCEIGVWHVDGFTREAGPWEIVAGSPSQLPVTSWSLVAAAFTPEPPPPPD